MRGREIWLRFATWILLALEFALAADLVRTAVAPTWDDISKLAVIATIRTMLNYFLAKDIAEFDAGCGKSGAKSAVGQATPPNRLDRPRDNMFESESVPAAQQGAGAPVLGVGITAIALASEANARGLQDCGHPLR